MSDRHAQPAPVAPAGEVGLSDEDGPECETCGRTTCPDADLPGFSEPRDCEFAPIFEAIRDSKDCDYGCARDLTNQAIRLEVVPAVERILAARLAAAEQRVTHWKRVAGHAREQAEGQQARAEAAEQRVRDAQAEALEEAAAQWASEYDEQTRRHGSRHQKSRAALRMASVLAEQRAADLRAATTEGGA